MKRILIISTILVQCLVSNSQVDTALIRGQVHSGNLKTVKIEWLQENPVYDIQKTYEAPVNDLGQFEIRIPVSRVAHGRIAAGNYTHYISLMPGDNFFADIDADTIKYTGKGARKNNFLYFIETKGYSEDKYYADYNSGKLSLKEFALRHAEFRDKRTELLRNYIGKSMVIHSKIKENKPVYVNEIEKSFIDYFLADNKAIYLSLLINYPGMYAYRHNVDEKSLELPEVYKHYRLFENVTDNDCVISGLYNNLINNLAAEKGMELFMSKNFKIEPFRNPSNIVLFDSLKGKTQEYVLAYLLCSNFATDRIDTTVFKKFKEIAKDPLTISTVKRAYNNYNRKIILTGQPLVKEFTETELEDTLGNTITFGKMMEQYHGKVVYLDIWGMYCGPCRGLMPATKKLKEKLEGKPIEFVYLAIDGKYKGFWKDVVNVSLTDKNHYYLKNRFDAKFMQFMEINWVPCFMIFDKSGRLIDFSAPLPDESNAEKKLVNLADEN